MKKIENQQIAPQPSSYQPNPSFRNRTWDAQQMKQIQLSLFLDAPGIEPDTSLKNDWLNKKKNSWTRQSLVFAFLEWRKSKTTWSNSCNYHLINQNHLSGLEPETSIPNRFQMSLFWTLQESNLKRPKKKNDWLNNKNQIWKRTAGLRFLNEENRKPSGLGFNYKLINQKPSSRNRTWDEHQINQMPLSGRARNRTWRVLEKMFDWIKL